MAGKKGGDNKKTDAGKGSKDAKGKESGKGKGKGGGGDEKKEKGGQSINVRHILVSIFLFNIPVLLGAHMAP